MISRTVVAATIAAGLFLSVTAWANDAVPVRVRIIQGSRQGTASFDPKLADLRRQLEQLSYTRWEQVGEEDQNLVQNKEVAIRLPDGSDLKIALERVQKETVTFQVKVPSRKAHSKLTISRKQRIVHQVTVEKDGVAVFVTIRPWP